MILLKSKPKRLIIFLIIFFFILIFVTCNKEEVKTLYEITGYVYSGCPKQPASNKIIHLHSVNGLLTGGPGDMLTNTSTDNNGYFKLTTSYTGFTNLRCDSQNIFTPIAEENLEEIVEIDLQSSAILKINLNVSNPYTANDTLYIPANAPVGQGIKIAGPFTSGFLNTSLLYGLGDIVQNNLKYNSFRSLYYQINTNIFSSELINIHVCDTSTVTFNIN